MIEVEQLRKEFRRVVAVRDVSFTAADGAITGLLGANGAGKTTTLRMIGGVLKPQAGQIRIDDLAPVEHPRAAQSKLGALLDHIGLYPRLTARENLTYFGRLRNILAVARLHERVEEVLSLLGLESMADTPASGFSQGERMKVALGRAIIHSPANLILDEPTNGLDVPTVRSPRSLLKSMRRHGTCIVFSSHVLEEVHTLSDHVVVIAKGSVVAQGTSQALCEKTNSATLEEAFVRLTTCEGAGGC